MTKIDIKATLKKLVSDEFGIDAADIEDTTHFANDLGTDDIDIVMLCMHVEEEYNLAIDEEVYEKWATFGDMFESVCKLLEVTE